MPSFGGPLMKVWKMVKNRLPFFGTLPFLRMSSGSMRTIASSGNGGEGVVGLVGEDVAVGEEQDARAARRLAAQVPAAVEQLPCDLKGDEGLARAGGEREQDALLVGGDGLQHALDGDVLVVAALEIAALVLEGHGGEAVAPGVRSAKVQVPEFVRRRVARHLAFRAALHVDAVDALAVGGVGEADGQLAGIVLGLRHAFGQRFIPRLGLDDGQFVLR